MSLVSFLLSLSLSLSLSRLCHSLFLSLSQTQCCPNSGPIYHAYQYYEKQRTWEGFRLLHIHGKACMAACTYRAAVMKEGIHPKSRLLHKCVATGSEDWYASLNQLVMPRNRILTTSSIVISPSVGRGSILEFRTQGMPCSNYC